MVCSGSRVDRTQRMWLINWEERASVRVDLITHSKWPPLWMAHILLGYVNGVNRGSSSLNFPSAVLWLRHLLKFLFVSTCQYSPRWEKTSRVLTKEDPLSQPSKPPVRNLCGTEREDLKQVLLVSMQCYCFLLLSRTYRFLSISALINSNLKIRISNYKWIFACLW